MFWKAEILNFQLVFELGADGSAKVPQIGPGSSDFSSYNLVALVIFHGCISPSFRPTQKLVVITRGAELVNPSWSFLFVREFRIYFDITLKNAQLNVKNQFFGRKHAEGRLCVHKRLRNWCFSASQIQMILEPILTENDSKNRDT